MASRTSNKILKISMVLILTLIVWRLTSSMLDLSFTSRADIELIEPSYRLTILDSEEGDVEEGEEPLSTERYYYPVRIEIPSIGVGLDVNDGYYYRETQSWDISDGVAYFATLSDLPSALDGNTLIYAHNKQDAFYPTKNLRVGDEIIVHTSDGSTLIYQYYGDEIVAPENDSLFLYRDRPRLTLLTCNGVFSSVRRLMYAELIMVIGSDGYVRSVVEARP